MAERQSQWVQQAREDMRHFVGYSVADELEKLERLKNFRDHFKRRVHAAPG